MNDVSIHFPTGVHDSNLHNKAVSLFATMQCIDPSIALLPLTNRELPTLLSGPSFLREFDLLKSYFTILHFESKSAKIYAYFKSTMKLNKIKFNPFVRDHLQKFKI